MEPSSFGLKMCAVSSDAKGIDRTEFERHERLNFWNVFGVAKIASMDDCGCVGRPW